MTKSGLPDYGMYAALENMGRLVDYGELAARLGSIVTFNREGNIVFWDDFENTPLKWDEYFTGAGYAINYTRETALSGGQCVKATTQNVQDRNAGLNRYFLSISEGRVGAEFAFSTDDEAVRVYFHIVYDNGVSNYGAYARLDTNSEKVEISVKGSGWVTVLEDIDIYKNKRLFHFFKIVADTDKKRYIRIMLDRYEANIEKYLLFENLFTLGRYIRIRPYVSTLENAAKSMYIDNFILTQNEP